MKKNLVFNQLFEPESSTYTYLLADKNSKEAVIIDPVIETLDRDIKLIKEMGLNLKYVLDTHVHADHITAASELRNKLGAKTCVSEDANVACVDVNLQDGQELNFGEFKVKAIATPGHTDSCISYYVEEMGAVFTGDALLIRGTGRTDFQQGSSKKLYNSITQKIFTLPDETKVYPGHDYRGQTVSSIELEKQYNPRVGLGKTEEDFVKIMSELKLANPKKIHEAVPANLLCGTRTDTKWLHPQMVDGIPEVTPEDVMTALNKANGKIRLIDVRMPEEFNNELSHIPGAELYTLGPAFEKFLDQADKEQEIVFVCRSGGRSGVAADMAVKKGFKKTANLVGGMIKWNELKLPTHASH